MFEILGAAFAFWGIYAIIACISKHEISIAITASVGLIAGISAGIVKADYTTLLGSIVAIICILSIVPLQVKSKRKEERKNSMRKTQNNNNISEDSKKVNTNQHNELISKMNGQELKKETIIEDLSNIVNSMDFDISLGEIKDLRKSTEQFTRNNLPQMFNEYKINKEKESILRIMKTFIYMYSHDEDMFLALKGKGLPIVNTAFGRYLPLYTDEKYLYKDTFTNCNKVGFRKLLETFYTLNECNMCEGIVVNYGTDNMMLFPKITLDNMQLDLLFDVPWKK